MREHIFRRNVAGRAMITGPLAVLIVFTLSFVFILSESIHRTIAAWFGCVCLLFLGLTMSVFNLCESVANGEGGHVFALFGGDGTVDICHESLESLMLSWIHFDVIGLLLGMMIIAVTLSMIREIKVVNVPR